jgi:hypothetical protein
MKKTRITISEDDKQFIYKSLQAREMSIKTLALVMDMPVEEIKRIYRLISLREQSIKRENEADHNREPTFVREKGKYSNKSPMGIASAS